MLYAGFHLKSDISLINIFWPYLFQTGIEGFDKASLSHTETIEKNVLPTKEMIAEEKSVN